MAASALRISRRVAPFLLGLSVYLLAEATALAGLALLEEVRELRFHPTHLTLNAGQRDTLRTFLTAQGYYQPDSVLGWSIRPNTIYHDWIATSLTTGERIVVDYHSNAQGLRGDRVYDSVPQVMRLAAFGDSFVHGSEVENGRNWVALLESDSLEAMNFGVGGYGIDQALLRYRAARAFRPQVVLIGLYPEQVVRGLNRWRPFYGGDYQFPSAKPRFILEDSLRLLPNPLAGGYSTLRTNPESTLAAIGAEDYHYRTRERAGPFDFSPLVRIGKLAGRIWREQEDGMLIGNVLRPESQAVRLANATLARFAAEVRAAHALPVLVICPGRRHVLHYRQSGRQVTEAIAAYARTTGLRVVDLHAAFEECDEACLDRSFAPQGHYSESGSRMVADYVRRQLTDVLAPTPLDPLASHGGR